MYIPKNIDFENVRIVTGAGEVDIERLITERLIFKLGAGETKIESLNITKNVILRVEQEN